MLLDEAGRARLWSLAQRPCVDWPAARLARHSGCPVDAIYRIITAEGPVMFLHPVTCGHVWQELRGGRRRSHSDAAVAEILNIWYQGG